MFNLLVCLLLSFVSASILRKKNEPFCLKNASKLTHEFLYDNFDSFSRQNGSFFFLKIEEPKNKSFKEPRYINITFCRYHIRKKPK